MRIAIVDDDVDFLAQTARLVAVDLERRGIQAEVAAFASSEKMLAAKPSAAFDMYLLDVMMPGLDGIGLARRIRRVQSDAPIVFFTTSKDFALESYSVRASDYVVKPFTHEAFAAALDEAFRRLTAARPQVVALKTSAGIVNLELKYCPDQFEIVGVFNHGCDSEYDLAKPVLRGKELYTRIAIRRRKKSCESC